MKSTNSIHHVFLALFLIAFSSCSEPEVEEFGNDFDRVKMDKLFSNIEEKDLGMGSVSVFKGGREDYQNSIGSIDIENSIAANAQSTYRIGSISKSFTAVMIMQLIDENKLSLDTTLDTFFPQMPNAAEITVEHMLRHRSGLFNYTDGEFEEERFTQEATRAVFIDYFIESGTLFNPGERAEYSNTNFVVLSFIVEDIDGKSYADVLNDRIVSPLGLANTRNAGIANSSNNEALSYFRENDTWTKGIELNYTLLQGAGSVVSTPTDVNKFYHALFNGQLVSESSLEEMTRLVDDWGLGLFEIPFYNKRGYGHTGAIDGFQSTSVYFPSDDVSFTYVSNAVSMNTNDIAIAVLSIYSGLEYDLP